MRCNLSLSSNSIRLTIYVTSVTYVGHIFLRGLHIFCVSINIEILIYFALKLKKKWI